MSSLSSLLVAVMMVGCLAGECEDQGGQCVDWRYYVCHAGLEVGLCPGDTNIRCCLHCDQICQDNEDQWSQVSSAHSQEVRSEVW